VPPIELSDLLETNNTEALHDWLTSASTLEIVDELSRLPPAETALAFRLLPRDRALDVFEELEPGDQQQVLDGLRDDRVLQLIEAMDPDDRARLLDELPAGVAARLLGQLDPEERAATALLLGYPENSAGRMMSPDYVSLRASMTVGEAFERIRREALDAETIYVLPVLDDERHLIGITGLRGVVLADPTDRVGDLMTTDEIHYVTTDTDREVAARLVQEAGLIALPVVDSEGRLVGVITVDDAMHVIEQEETEDIAFSGASAPLGKPYLAVSALGLAKARALWLLVLIVAATLTVNVLQYFETTLDQAVTLAVFIPLLIGTGGNSGAQASTAVIRAIAVGEVRLGDLPRVVWRETRTGLMLGGMLAVAVLVPVSLFYDAKLALVVALTLVAICTWATAAGSALPLLARRVGVDPAVVSAPLITTLVDATGLIIYFLIAQTILGL
jgi:magnesium transporter